MMATEKRLMSIDDFKRNLCHYCNTYMSDEPCEPGECWVYDVIAQTGSVDAVEVEKYKALVEMYHELRENFIDYVCSGTCNVAPYCLNRCEGCVDRVGWCAQGSDECHGFNPAEVVLDGDGNG